MVLHMFLKIYIIKTGARVYIECGFCMTHVTQSYQKKIKEKPSELPRLS